MFLTEDVKSWWGK